MKYRLRTILIHPQIVTFNSSIHTCTLYLPPLTPEILIKGPWILFFILILVETYSLTVCLLFPNFIKTKEEYFK